METKSLIDSFIGSGGQEHREVLATPHPIASGLVTNWDDMQRTWRHIYDNRLATQAESHPVLVCERPMTPQVDK